MSVVAVESGPESEPGISSATKPAPDDALSSAQVQDLLLSEPLAIAAAQTITEPASDANAGAEPAPVMDARDEAAAAPPTSAATHSDESELGPGGDEQVILDTPDGYFALQVIAAKSAQEVAEYFEPSASSTENATSTALNIRIFSQGNEWFVGIAGLYPDYQSAAAALQALPISAAAWIRPVKGLKQAVLAAEKP